MRKLLKYFKPYLPAFLAATILLYGQVMLELALPGMLSNIVTQGIQQQGVEDIIPEALSQETFIQLQNSMSSEDRKLFEEAYTLHPKLDQTSSDKSQKLARKFTLLKEQDIYLLTSRSKVKQLADKGILLTAICSLSPVPVREMYKEQTAIRILAEEYDKLGYGQGERQTSVIFRLGSRMVIFTLLSAVLVIIVGLLGARTSSGMARTLRSDVFTKVQNFSQAEMDSFSTASLITRSTNDINQIQRVVFMMMRLVIFAPLMGIGGFIRAVETAPSMSWLIGLAVLSLLGFVSVAIVLAMPRFRKIQTLVDRVNQLARENLTGLMVIKAFNREGFVKDRFDKANRELTDTNLFVMRVMAMMMPAIGLIMNLLSVAIIWVGAQQIADSALNVGDMMAFLQYATRIVISFMLLTMIFSFLPRAAVSAERISKVLNKDISIKNPTTPVSLPAKTPGLVEFKNVSFRYSGAEERALKNISFTAEPGKMTAVIGSTGSGKSTLVNLIPRLYDISEGSILLDGMELRQLDLTELRRSIAMVPQKNTLFKGTIASNLSYGTDLEVDDEKLMQALNLAQGSNILEEKEEGMNSKVSQGGANFSGGQKQRLAIARALASDRQIMIFDDSFSALDYKTDRALRQDLKKQYQNKTLLVVAQRVSTIMHADQILVLNEGEIVGKGTHQDLLKDCPTYIEIAQSQLNLEELA